jgi:hypothetical protein
MNVDLGWDRSVCLFCGGEPLTREHAFPQWLYGALGVQGRVSIATGGHTLRRVPEFDVTLRAVCGACNHGWLNELEQSFAGLMTPSLHGGGVSLNREQQRMVALWGVKTWMLLEYALAHHRGGRLSSPGIFRYLKETREPPPYVQVHLGQVAAKPPCRRL